MVICLKIEFKAGKEECSRIVEIVMGKQLTALTLDGENQKSIVSWFHESIHRLDAHERTECGFGNYGAGAIAEKLNDNTTLQKLEIGCQ